MKFLIIFRIDVALKLRLDVRLFINKQFSRQRMEIIIFTIS